MSKLKKWLWSHKFTLLTLLYLCIICFSFTAGEGTLIPKLMALLSILTIPVILNVLAKTEYSIPITLLLAFFISVDAYFAFVYHCPVYVGVAASIFETNMNEASEVMGEALLPGIAILVLTSFLLIMSQRELKTFKFSRIKSLAALGAYLFIFIPICYWDFINSNPRYVAEFKANPLSMVQQMTLFTLPIFYNDVLTLAAYKYEMYKFKTYVETDRQMPDGIAWDETAEQPEKIYLVIGESSWREHYSLYGYSVPTTPFLDSMNVSNPNDLKHYMGIGPAAITREALRITLTFSSPSAMNPFFEKKNIIELAKDAGYETIWVSDQDQVGMYDSYIGFVSACSDRTYFPKAHDHREDLDLITTLSGEHKSGKKQFFIIHLMGSHKAYSERYDEVDELAIVGAAKSEENNDLNYDRSIHHTDRVLRNIYQIMAQDSTALIVYFSDHGEKIGVGHGFMNLGGEQFEIPYVTIHKNAPKIDAIIPRYIDKGTNLLNSSSSIYILAEVLGYKIPEFYVEEALSEGKKIFHVDSNTYLFEDIKRKGSAVD